MTTDDAVVAAATVTFFDDKFAKSKREKRLTLQELAGRFRSTTGQCKDLLPLFKLARFGGKATPNGSLRSNENVIEITGVEGDYDGELMPFHAAVATVVAAGLNAILYTSPSNTEMKPRWRVVCPTSKPWPPDHHRRLVARLNGVFGGRLSDESFTLSQTYYYGSIVDKPSSKIEIVDGVCIDEREDLDAKAIDKRKTERGAEDQDHPRGHGFEAHLASMGDGEGREGFNFPICRAAGAYAVRHGPDLDRTVLKAKLIAAIKAAPTSPDRRHKPNDVEYYLSDVYLDRAIATAVDKYGNARTSEFTKANGLSEDDFAFIAAQANLGTVEYQRGRKAAAKEKGIGVAALDKLVGAYRNATSPAQEKGDPTQADVLLIIADQAKLFHTAEGVGYADILVNGHRETWAVASKGFKDWLTREYFAKMQAPPGNYGMDAALALIEAKARFDAPTQEVFLRTARIGDKIYLDLCDDEWRAVKIDKDGWRIVASPAAHFRRARGMLPLPAPEKGGSIDDLRPFVNLPQKRLLDPKTGEERSVDENFVLAVGWQLGALSGIGPYAILALGGLHGSAKTFTGRVLRETIDPNKVPQRALPRHDHDLYIAGGNALILAFDNISTLPDWLSDTLCRLSTGGGFAARELYTDADEKLFDGMRPLMLNGIEDFVTRPDLGDRTIIIVLEEITDKTRRTERKMWSEFEAMRPKILAALLDAVAHGLGAQATTSLAALPRMADFAEWVAACEGALWKPGTFAAAYAENRRIGQIEMLDTDTVAAAVIKFTRNPPPELDAEGRVKPQSQQWTGTAATLLDYLNNGFEYVDEQTKRDRRWPSTPRQLGGRLRRLAKSLKLVSIDVTFVRGKQSDITLKNTEQGGGNGRGLG